MPSLRLIFCAGIGLALATPSLARAQADLASDVDPVDFGSEKVGTPVAASITLTNSGVDDANVTGFSLSGAAPGDFAIVSPATPFVIPGSGGTQVVDLEFTPSASGVRGATLTVAFDPPAASTLDVALTGTGVRPAIAVAPDPLTFTGRLVFTPSGSQMVTIDNPSTVPLEITNIQLVSGNTGDFGLTTSVPVTVPAMGSTTFSATFTPQAAGARSATVRITSDAATSPTNMTVQGTGLAPQLTVTPASLPFGNVRLGSSSGVQSFSIRNDGDSPMNVTSVGIVGGNSEDYAVDSFSGTLNPAQTRTINVTFTPLATGAQNATVVVTTTNPLAPTSANVSLTGTGTQALLSLTPAAGFDYGNIEVGLDSSAGVFAFQNTGNVSLTVNSLAFGAPDGSQFVQTAGPGTPFAVGPGATRTVTVRCRPTSVGDKVSSLIVTTDADNAASVPMPPLACRGISPEISVAPTSRDFGSVLVGSSANRTFTVSNAAGALSAPLDVTITEGGANPGQFSSSPTSFTVPPGGNQVVTVTYAPTFEGAASAQMRVNSNDLDEPLTIVNVTGNGVKPEITLVAPGGGSINFGGVNVSTSSAPSPVTVRNDGSSNLTITGVSLAGANPGEFAIVGGSVPPPSIVLAPGASTTWMLAFNPTSTGAKSATFRINSDDADEGTVSVPLSGQGIQAQLTVAPSPVQFPATRVCESATPITVTVRNSGTADLTVTAVTLTPAAIFPVVTAPPSLPRTLGPNQSFTLQVGFVPTMHSDFAGTLTVESDDPTGGMALINVLGPGRVADMGLAPMAHDYNAVRVDRPPVANTFTVKNEGTADFVVGGVTIDDTTNFTVQPLSPGSFPYVLSPAPAGPGGTGEEATFEVIAHPTTLGAHAATATVTTDIPGCMGPIVATVGVDAEGVAPELALTPSALDYGGHDVQAEFPRTEVVTIRNSGGAPLQVDEIRLTGVFANEFGLVDPPTLPLTIAPMGTLDLDVAFQPAFERECNSSDGDALVTVETDGFAMPTAQARLDGCGLDRELGLSTMALPFPPTYRNPKDPTELEVTVGNLGTFELAVFSTTTDDENVFRVREGGPRTIAPDGSHTLIVEFHPNAASAIEFDGFLIITNDDDEQPMAMIRMSGLGVLPEVAVGPGNVSFGGTAIGATAKAPTGQKIQINNMNPDRAFTVRELRLVDAAGQPLDDSAFRVVGFDRAREVPAMGSLSVDVEFTPDGQGMFQGRVEVYIDEDPEMHAFVTLTGEGVGAQLRGGGCGVADGGTGSGAAWLVLIGLGLLCVRRKAAVVAVLALAAGTASAEPTRNLDLSTFRPALTGDPDLFTVQSPFVGAAGTWGLGVFVHHAVNPLEVIPMAPGEVLHPVASRTVTELAFVYGLSGRWELGAIVPILQQSGDAPMLNVQPAEGTSLGDVEARAKVELLDASPFSLGASFDLTVPTASDGQFAGVDGPTGVVRAIVGLDIDSVRVGINGGVRVRGTSELLDVNQGNELTFGLGMAYQAGRRVSVVGEVFGARGLGDSSGEATSPLEVAVGTRYRASRSMGIALGVGRGVLPGIGAPDFRSFLLVSYAPGSRELPAVPVRVVDPDDVNDDDGDGLVNSADKCPDEGEDMDDFEDEDGCPDRDNDGDGFRDAEDKCPLEPEDMDGFEDDDGCIDPDNDGDGIPDTQDECPDEVEDFDGFRDRDGCEDPDNDRDGIPDVLDQCAVEPETINGRDDDDGCPDDGDSAILEAKDRIELVDMVRFRGSGATLTKGGKQTLDQVGALLRARPEWKQVRIGVHVHPRGSSDDELSRRRADAVRAYLVEWGVDSERLVIKAHGSARPLVPPNARRARSLNDRVEFVVVERRK